VQRHRHDWAPTYVPPGRDAAVAQRTIDLQLRNPYPWPVQIHAHLTENSLGFEILGCAQGPMTRVINVPLGMTPPAEVIKVADDLPPGHRKLLTRGRPGPSIAIYREYLNGPHAGERRFLSRDTYPAMNRVVAVGR
jgi:vancomycin resistance protein YoaR